MLLSEAIERLIIETKFANRSKATVQFYKRRLRPLLEFLGDVPIETITRHDLLRFIAYLRDRETLYDDHPIREAIEQALSIATINGFIRAVRRLFHYLEEEGLISNNPARKLRRIKDGAKEPRGIEREDFLALLKTTCAGTDLDLRDRASLFVLFDTGCRIGGLCGIKLEDIFFDRGLLRLTEKGSKTRYVPFLPITAQALRAWLEVRPQNRGDYLFVGLAPNSRGRLTDSGVRQMLKRRAEEAGVTGRVNPHSFRHNFAREYLLDGGDMATASDLMGHKGIEVLKENYAIFNVRELQEKHKLHSPLAQLQALAEFQAIMGDAQ